MSEHDNASEAKRLLAEHHFYRPGDNLTAAIQQFEKAAGLEAYGTRLSDDLIEIIRSIDPKSLKGQPQEDIFSRPFIERPGTVEWFKVHLNMLGYYNASNGSIDDVRTAVRSFQKDFGLEIDGKGSPQVYELLDGITGKLGATTEERKIYLDLCGAKIRLALGRDLTAAELAKLKSQYHPYDPWGHVSELMGDAAVKFASVGGSGGQQAQEAPVQAALKKAPSSAEDLSRKA